MNERLRHLCESDRQLFDETGGLLLGELDTTKEGVRAACDIVEALYVDLFHEVRRQLVLIDWSNEGGARSDMRSAFIMDAVKTRAVQQVDQIMQRPVTAMIPEGVDKPSEHDILAMLLPLFLEYASVITEAIVGGSRQGVVSSRPIASVSPRRVPGQLPVIGYSSTRVFPPRPFR